MQSPPPPLPLFPIDTAQTAPLAERKSGNASPLQPYSVPLPPSPASPSLPTTLSADATNAMRAQGLPSPTPRPFLLTPSRPTAPQPASHLALPAPSNTQTKPSGKRNQSLQTPTPIRTGPSSLFSLQQPQQYLHQPYPQPANIHPHLSAHHHQHHQQHALLPSGVVAQGPVTAQLQNGLPLHYAHGEQPSFC
ncbi:hypothetical protein DFJ73DRAFT_873872 [Zopfochytrium polystomum]|nr:hypothetical protein DFJ73DRAFT_873872 [Zopfochytrium polystomum]